MVLSKAALILWLFPSLLASPQVPALGAAQSTHHALRSTGATAVALPLYSSRETRRRDAAVARAVERRLLVLSPRVRFLHRFVDSTTGLVKRNVTVHCYRVRGMHHGHRLRRFVCRIWVQPRSRLSGVAVVCHTGRHMFRVTVYHRRHKH